MPWAMSSCALKYVAAPDGGDVHEREVSAGLEQVYTGAVLADALLTAGMSLALYPITLVNAPSAP